MGDLRAGGWEPHPMEAKAIEMLKDMLREGRPVRVAVKGRSMLPLLRPGDVAELEFLDGPPKKGDVLAVRMGSRLIVHRVARVEGPPDSWKAFLRGDGHTAEHGPHGEADVIGKLARVRRGGRWIGCIRWSLSDKISRTLSLARKARSAAGRAAGRSPGK
jgi:hypothetical protein